MNMLAFSDIESLSVKAAELFLDLSEKTISEKKIFIAGVSGGSTPERLYTLLGSTPFRDNVDWSHIHFFWADERFVPHDHEESNYRLLYDRLISRISIPPENIHPVRTDSASPAHAAECYEEEISNFFHLSGGEFPAFDLIMLGMGQDGHTASLFPCSKSLNEKTRIAVPVHMKKPDPDRVTLTLPALNNSGQILFLVAGRSKSKVLKAVFDPEQRRKFPAGLIEPYSGSLTWLIDKEAAEELSPEIIRVSSG
jgi:6-phosphogluconolactonase